MFFVFPVIFLICVPLIHAFDDHAYKIKSALSQTTVRVDMHTKQLIVSDEEYPGWSEFFYMFADPGGDTFTLANFAFRDSNDLGVDCSVHHRPCEISHHRTHFRLSDPSLNINTETSIISVDGAWAVDGDALPNATIQFETPDGSLRQSFILLRWE
ncbi:hypothetical protein BC941DRAFT_421207 [Chlamydoabsidia padenii]|nr:hypothetical protein BC941DRAFT_421207 [Chlamydoabsidia padenii]